MKASYQERRFRSRASRAAAACRRRRKINSATPISTTPPILPAIGNQAIATKPAELNGSFGRAISPKTARNIASREITR